MNNSSLASLSAYFAIACAACSSPDSGASSGGASASGVGGARGDAGGETFSRNTDFTAGTTSTGAGGTDAATTARATGGQRASGGGATGGTNWQTGGSKIGVGGAATMGGAVTGGAATGGRDTQASGGISASGGKASTSKGDVGGAVTGGVRSSGGAPFVAGGSSAAGATFVAGGSSSAGATGVVSSPGCGKSPTLTSGSRTIQSAGQSRSYMLRIPDNYDKSHPYRLIFAFHWNGGSMTDIDGGGTSGAAWSYYGLREQANNSTVFVAPQGISNGWANTGGRDLTLVDDLIQLIEGDLCVDTRQLYSVGFSYGGGMSYELACARPNVFRAVAVYSGALLSGCDGGKQPIAYLGIHGVSDARCGIAGGRSLRDTFVNNNGCTAQSPPEPAAGSGKHICTKYQGCKAGYPVEWCAFDGEHTPGNVDGGGDDGAKTWTKGEVWKFFTQFAETN